MRLLIVLLFPLFLNGQIFKVANYNVENLFDLVKQGREYKEYIPNTTSWNKKTLEMKLKHTAQVICDIEADVIGLEEIENKNALSLLQNKLKQVGCAYRYSAITHKLGSTIQVALLSKYKIISSKDIKVPSSRSILNVLVQIEGKSINFFVNHWKSMGRNGLESKRIKSARVLQKHLLTLNASRDYIILGDFNSDYNAFETLDKKLDDTQGKRGINHILQSSKNNQLITQSQIQTAPQGYHYNLWLELPSQSRWSYNFFGKKGTLDNMLLPKSLFDGKGIDYVNNSFGVFKASYLFTKKGYIKRWRYKGYSDHLPIFASFSTSKVARVIKGENKSQKSMEKEEIITKKTINNLYTSSLHDKIKLENIVVIYKRGDNAIIKQRAFGRGIYLFACAMELKEGYKYDLIVDKVKSYNGLKEITAIEVLKQKGKVPLSRFYKKKLSFIKQNEVIKDIEGVYDNNYFITNKGKISIYFKNRRDKPKNKTKIKIKYGHIGYYHKVNLVIFDKKDFEIRRK